MNVDVSLVPGAKTERNCEAKIAVVIDVFRATSSIAYALHNGCKVIYPVASVQEALSIHGQYPDTILAGERQGLKISGFHLGNSPLEFTSQAVAGRKVIMTTTNGTHVLNLCSKAHSVYTAAFINSRAIIRTLRQLQSDVSIVCAGSDGKFSLEDALCAGFLVDNLQSMSTLTEEALSAMTLYRKHRNSLVNDLIASPHAQYLIEKEYGADIDFCVQFDTVDVVPLYGNHVINKASDYRRISL